MGNSSPNKAEFLRLYTSIQPKLFSFILAVVHNRNDADELFQEATVILWEKYDQYNTKMNFGAWAIGIAKNKVLEYLRRNKKQKNVFDEHFYDQISELAAQSSDDISDRIGALNVCVRKLKSPDQKLLSLRYCNNKSVCDISQQMGRSPNSLYKSLARIIFLLRNCISHQLASKVIYEV